MEKADKTKKFGLSRGLSSFFAVVVVDNSYLLLPPLFFFILLLWKRQDMFFGWYIKITSYWYLPMTGMNLHLHWICKPIFESTWIWLGFSGRLFFFLFLCRNRIYLITTSLSIYISEKEMRRFSLGKAAPIFKSNFFKFLTFYLSLSLFLQ